MGKEKEKKCECCGKVITGKSIVLVGQEKNYIICEECWKEDGKENQLSK